MRTLFYKGYERITEKERDEILELFGDEPYNTFEYVETNDSLDVHPELAEVIFLIENDRRLNERFDSLIERIKRTSPKLTPSSSYYSTSVEHNICRSLMVDAVIKFNKETESNVNVSDLWCEIHRYFGLPYETYIQGALKKARRNTRNIPEPTEKFNWKDYFDYERGYGYDTNDCYLEYHIKVKNCYGFSIDQKKHSYYKQFPYLGKLYYVYDKKYIQIYVYDKANRHWAVNNVIQALIKDNLIELD
jgi:hypothetical protein